MAESMRGKAAVTGIGETKYSRSADRSTIGLMLEASMKAIVDAGIEQVAAECGVQAGRADHARDRGHHGAPRRDTESKAL